MSLNYFVKYEYQKTTDNLKKCIEINDKSQGSITKHLSCDVLLYYKFITQFASERIFKIGEHLAKLWTEWLIVLCAAFALRFFPQICRTHCWLGDRKGIRPVKKEWWGAGMVVGLEQGADLHTAQLMPLPLTVSCFTKIQIGFTFVPAHRGSPGKRAVKLVCVCVCMQNSPHK